MLAVSSLIFNYTDGFAQHMMPCVLYRVWLGGASDSYSGLLRGVYERLQAFRREGHHQGQPLVRLHRPSQGKGLPGRGEPAQEGDTELPRPRLNVAFGPIHLAYVTNGLRSHGYRAPFLEKCHDG